MEPIAALLLLMVIVFSVSIIWYKDKVDAVAYDNAIVRMELQTKGFQKSISTMMWRI